MRGLLIILYFGIHQVVMLPWEIRATWHRRRGNVSRARVLGGVFGKVWARSLVRIAGARVSVEGAVAVPKGDAVLFVSNHQGAFDIPVLLARLDRPVGFIAKASLARTPMLGRWMRVIHCVFVQRGDRTSAKAAHEAAVALLQGGQSLVVFPEGTRSESEELAAFKSGSFRIAVAAGVPVVPVAVDGTFEIFSPSSKRVRPARVRVVISPPIASAGKDAEVLAREARLEIRKNLERRVDKAIRMIT